MNSLLLNKQPGYFNVSLATKIGLNEAIILQKINYWIESNKERGINYHDNRYWTYNSITEWHEKEFPFLPLKAVRMAFKFLIDNNFLLVGNYNKNKMDRTTWYSINEEKLEVLVKEIDKEEQEKAEEALKRRREEEEINSAEIIDTNLDETSNFEEENSKGKCICQIGQMHVYEKGKCNIPINNIQINNYKSITQSKNFNNYNKKIEQNGVFDGVSEGLCQELESCDFIYQKILDNYTETVNQGDTSYELLKVIADKVKNDSEMIKIQGKFIHKSCVLEKLNEYFDNYEAWLDVLERITDVDKKRGIKNKYKFILTLLYEETILPNSSKRNRKIENKEQMSDEEIEEFLKILNTGNDILKYIEADANEEVQ